MSGEKKPIFREVTILMTLAEAYRVMGKEGGEWSKDNRYLDNGYLDNGYLDNGYLDADSYDDVHHDGYMESQVLGIDFREYVA
jgi:hypothetical protein